jgi:hypothetical protein
MQALELARSKKQFRDQACSGKYKTRLQKLNTVGEIQQVFQ